MSPQAKFRRAARRAALRLSRRVGWPPTPEPSDGARRLERAYAGLLAAVQGVPPGALEAGFSTSSVLPDKATDQANRRLAQELYNRTRLTQALINGQPLEDAVATYVRSEIEIKNHVAARSLAQSLQANPATATAGHLGSALVARHLYLPELAMASFAEVPASTWQRLSPREFIECAVQVDPKAAAEVARRVLADPPQDMPPDGWLALVQAMWRIREERLACDLFEVAQAQAAVDPDAWADSQVDRDWLAPWFRRAIDPPAAAAVPAGHVAIGVIDYKQPDRRQTSSNLGDYTQTVAMLGHLARHGNITFHGPEDLVQEVTQLQERVRPDRRLDTAARDVTLVPFSRDASSYDSLPEGTWAIVFGWFMQSQFGRHDFPFHRNLRPIFVSFHVHRPAMLTPEALSYLGEHGPIGCRDWNTVHLLLSAGVPAFFSGCITTTVDTVFPGPDQKPDVSDKPRAFVDVPARDGDLFLTQAGEEIRHAGLVPNLRAAVELLDSYRRDYSKLVTSRLHCYLPARSVGVDVDFTPKNRADVRFNGLLDLTDEAFAQMQRGILDTLEPAATAILAGRRDAEVYQAWREACAEAVAVAEARHAAVPAIAPPSFDVAQACAVIRAGQTEVLPSAPGPTGQAVDVALALDGNLKEEMNVVIEAMATNCSRPLHLWILCRDHGPADYERLAGMFPGVHFTWLPCDSVDYGPVLGMLQHITVSTMDRLLLPDLLPELDRILYHDIDALPLGDVAELADWDLQGHPLAGRSSVARSVRSGFENFHRNARRLRADGPAADDLLLRMQARHAYDFLSFNAGILVLDLDQMRRDEFGRHYLPFVEQYGMNDQEVLNCYAGGRRAVLPSSWNSLPTQEVVQDPRIIHWAGPSKPWKPQYVALREHWARYADQLSARLSPVGRAGPAATPAPEVALEAPPEVGPGADLGFEPGPESDRRPGEDPDRD